MAMGGEAFLPPPFPFAGGPLYKSFPWERTRQGQAGAEAARPEVPPCFFGGFWLVGELKSSISCCHRQGWALAQMWVKSDTLWTTYSFSRVLQDFLSCCFLFFSFLFIYLFLLPPCPPALLAETLQAPSLHRGCCCKLSQPQAVRLEQHSSPLKSVGL